jgi:hypothetical protein
MPDDIINLIQKICSGVLHIEFLVGDKCVGSGSGFISQNYLITNNHVYVCAIDPTISHVKLSWQSGISTASRKEKIYQRDAFIGFLKGGSTEEIHDFAILDVPDLKTQDLHDFMMESPNKMQIGEEALILGYPLEHKNLVCHKAFISSFYQSGKTNIIQLDASVNNSNSGGPLVDITTGNVIGIVTRKGTGLIKKMFSQLFAAFDDNINYLLPYEKSMGLSGFYPVKMLIAGQNQMKELAKQIQRSANVGIGYAHSVEHILQDSAFHDEIGVSQDTCKNST